MKQAGLHNSSFDPAGVAQEALGSIGLSSVGTYLYKLANRQPPHHPLVGRRVSLRVHAFSEDYV
ncbi:MAG TPA: hypothetical protein VK457_15070, partial [Chloroflexota bacterium]|nr:hypothetical protein [Chloroflexota bacterium]